MTPESPWGSDRWRISAAYSPHHAASSPQPQQQLQSAMHQYYQPSHLQHQPSRIPMPAPQAYTPTNQSIAGLNDRSNTTPMMPHELPRLTDPVPAVAYHSRHGDTRQNPSYPREAYAGSWRSLQDDRCSSSSHSADAPQLTLHIPPNQASALPKLSTAFPPETQSRGASNFYTSTPTPSLPSFATFQERSKGSNDDVDGPEIAPMSSRLSCDICPTLKPLIQRIAVALGELDENVQVYCNRPGLRALDIPKENPINVAQWILDRLPSMRADLHDVNRKSQVGQQHQPTGFSSHNLSPPNTLKRSGDQWEREDLPAPKRPRSGASTELPFQLPVYTPREERRASVDFAYGREPHQGYSPPPTESVPGSAYPRQTSPVLTNRLSTRALPSPSSFPSAAPSLPPPTVASVGSPATSYQQTTSIHTASTNPVTSAHIADLQHQVTLKSLSLQTLQTEYASLLQKLQRERVKSQTIEKKTSVADQEVNDLTSKNDDLNDRVRELEKQLEDCEKKRDTEMADAVREKEQWGRMLKMNDNLYAKVNSARQRLSEEKAVLEQRIASLEGRAGGVSSINSTPIAPLEVEKNKLPGLVGMTSQSQHGSSGLVALGSAAQFSGVSGNSEVADLRREIVFLNERVISLRSSLEGARLYNQDLENRTRDFLEHNTHWGASIERALKEDGSKARNQQKRASASSTTSNRSTPPRQKPKWDSPQVPAGSTASLTTQAAPFHHTSSKKSPPATFEYISNGKRSTAIVAEVARAVSPGPEELGFHVAPTTSSPEELIRALGPVPAPIPSLQSGQHYDWHPIIAPDNASHEVKRSPPRAIHHLPSWRSSVLEHSRPAGSSPRSYHSSPGELRDDGGSSSNYSEKSPEAYVSEPEPTTSSGVRTSSEHAQFSSAVSRPEDIPGHRNWMPPPPRPIDLLPRTQI